jgi:hypothetical protein
MGHRPLWELKPKRGEEEKEEGMREKGGRRGRGEGINPEGLVVIATTIPHFYDTTCFRVERCNDVM